MGEGLNKFKRKMRVGAIVRGLLLGFAAGFAVFAVLHILDKQRAFETDVAVRILIAAGVALITLITAICVLVPSEKRAARKIDKALRLNEKAQTMVAYKNDDSDMVCLQREDTDTRLKGLPTRGIGFRGIVALSLIFILSCAMLTSSIVIPGVADNTVEENEGEPDIPWSISEYQRVALTQLIAEVEASAMEQDAKEDTADILKDLLYALENTVETEKAMKENVISAIVEVDAVSDRANTYLAISRKLLANGDDSMQKLGKMIELLDPYTVRDKMEVLFVSNFMGSDVALVTRSFASAISAALDNSMTDSGVMLNIALYNFADSLSFAVDDGNASNDFLQIDNAFSSAADDLVDALAYQKTNFEMRNKIIDRLTELFGITQEELPNLDSDGSSQGGVSKGDDEEVEKPKDDDENLSGDGGLGTGEIIYGSDKSYVYDPEQNKTVLYGEVVGGYHGEFLRDVLSGSVSDELKDLMDAYFDILFSGTKENDKD